MGLKRKNDEDGGEGADPAKASKIDIDIAKASKLDPLPTDANKRSMQGQGEGANKHSIDSDDEEDDRDAFGKFEELKDDDIEGQEEDTVTQEGDIKITPFNLKEEQQEGRFSKDGDFVWNAKDELKDAWLDDVDWVKVKQKSAEELEKEEEADDKEDEAQAQYSEAGSYKLVRRRALLNELLYCVPCIQCFVYGACSVLSTEDTLCTVYSVYSVLCTVCTVNTVCTVYSVYFALYGVVFRWWS